MKRRFTTLSFCILALLMGLLTVCSGDSVAVEKIKKVECSGAVTYNLPTLMWRAHIDNVKQKYPNIRCDRNGHERLKSCTVRRSYLDMSADLFQLEFLDNKLYSVVVFFRIETDAKVLFNEPPLKEFAELEVKLMGMFGAPTDVIRVNLSDVNHGNFIMAMQIGEVVYRDVWETEDVFIVLSITPTPGGLSIILLGRYNPLYIESRNILRPALIEK